MVPPSAVNQSQIGVPRDASPVHLKPLHLEFRRRVLEGAFLKLAEELRAGREPS